MPQPPTAVKGVEGDLETDKPEGADRHVRSCGSSSFLHPGDHSSDLTPIPTRTIVNCRRDLPCLRARA